MQTQEFQDLLQQLVSLMGFSDAEVLVKEGEEAVEVDINLPEEEAGMLIGYHGEKIDALQLLCSIMFNRDRDEYVPVHTDVAGYRQRRQESLEQLADQAISQAIENQEEILLPPLPAHERRLIHIHVKKHGQVDSYSEGREPHRRVVITPLMGESSEEA